jgi:hypothetical protein
VRWSRWVLRAAVSYGADVARVLTAAGLGQVSWTLRSGLHNLVPLTCHAHCCGAANPPLRLSLGQVRLGGVRTL